MSHRGGGFRQVPKKCRVLFELPLNKLTDFLNNNINKMSRSRNFTFSRVVLKRLVSVAEARSLSGTLLIKGFYVRLQQTAKFVSDYFRHSFEVM